MIRIIDSLEVSMRRAACVLMLGAILAGSACAQEGARPFPPPEASRPADGPGDFPPIVDRMLGGNPFRPSPEDARPPAPGELDALLRFAQEHVPALARQIQQQRQRGGPQFDREFARRGVARLRHLQRIQQSDPAMFDAIVQHAENTMRIRQLARDWALSKDRPMLRGRLSDDLRRRVRENVDVEAGVLARKREQVERDRERLVDGAMRDAENPPPAPANAPPGAGPGPRPDRAVADLLRRIRETDDPDQQQRLRGELRRMMSGRVERAISAIREREQKWSRDADEIAEHALERIQREADQEIERRGSDSAPHRPPPQRP